MKFQNLSFQVSRPIPHSFFSFSLPLLSLYFTSLPSTNPTTTRATTFLWCHAPLLGRASVGCLGSKWANLIQVPSLKWSCSKLDLSPLSPILFIEYYLNDNQVILTLLQIYLWGPLTPTNNHFCGLQLYLWGMSVTWVAP